MIVVSWNVHDGLEESGRPFNIAAELRDLNPDLLALQEFPLGSDEDTKRLGIELNLPFSAGWDLEPSEQSGLLMLSRWPISQVQTVTALPPTRSTIRDHEPLRAHRKGVLVASIGSPSGTFRFGCVHLFPFHLFGLPDDTNGAREIWSELASQIEGEPHDDLVLAGDFNAPTQLRIAILPSGLYSTTGELSTRTDGRSHDDILLGRNWNLLSSGMVTSKSDHFVCWSSIENSN